MDSGDTIGEWNSIALDANDNPYITFNSPGGNLNYASLTVLPTVTTNLKVNVIDVAGNPVPGANIVSTAQPSGQTALSGTSTTGGTSLFSNLLPGGYTVQISKSGYVTETKTVSVAAGGTAGVTVTLRIPSIYGDLKVTVKDNLGALLSGASVSSTVQPSGQSALSGTTVGDGSVTFLGVSPGSYTVQVAKSGYVSGSVQGT